MKKVYEAPEMEQIVLEREDIICTSGDSGDNDVDAGGLWGDDSGSGSGNNPAGL